MKRKVRIFLLMASIVVLALPAVPAQAAGRTWTVIAGGGTRDFSVSLNAFHPRTIEVAVGDTVAWKFEGFHNVAFLSGTPLPSLTVQEVDKTYANPRVFFPAGQRTYDGTGYVNSGTPPEDPAAAAKFQYSLTFTKPGTYRYVCIVHGPGMGGTVVVKERVSGSPDAVLARARKEQAAAIGAGQAAWTRFQVRREGKNVVVPVIGDLKSGYSILRFTPKPLVISLGTTVVWRMADPFEIHTVTIEPGKHKHAEFVIPQPQKAGPPKLLLNPKYAAPTGTETYAGTGYVNSGIMFPPGTPGNLPTSFSLTFTKPGRYEYFCAVHDPAGQKGVVIVR